MRPGDSTWPSCCVRQRRWKRAEEFIRNGKPDIDAVLTTKELGLHDRELYPVRRPEPTAPDTLFSTRWPGGRRDLRHQRRRHRSSPPPSGRAHQSGAPEHPLPGVRGLSGLSKSPLRRGSDRPHGRNSGLGNAETLINTKAEKSTLTLYRGHGRPTGCIGGAGQPESFLRTRKRPPTLHRRQERLVKARTKTRW